MMLRFRLTQPGLDLIGHAVSEKKMFAKYDHIHVYSPGAGTENPLGTKLFHKHKSSCTFFFKSRINGKNGFL